MVKRPQVLFNPPPNKASKSAASPYCSLPSSVMWYFPTALVQKRGDLRQAFKIGLGVATNLDLEIAQALALNAFLQGLRQPVVQPLCGRNRGRANGIDQADRMAECTASALAPPAAPPQAPTPLVPRESSPAPTRGHCPATAQNRAAPARPPKPSMSARSIRAAPLDASRSFVPRARPHARPAS